MRNPRSLHTLGGYYNPLTPEGKYIEEWLQRQTNYNEAIREIIYLFGDQYDEWKKANPKPIDNRATFYQRRRLAGLCVRCGKPAFGKSRCPECLAKLRKK